MLTALLHCAVRSAVPPLTDGSDVVVLDSKTFDDAIKGADISLVEFFGQRKGDRRRRNEAVTRLTRPLTHSLCLIVCSSLVRPLQVFGAPLCPRVD